MTDITEDIKKAKARQYQKKLYKWKLARGRCTGCKDGKAIEGRTMCYPCLHKNRMRTIGWQKRKREMNNEK